MKDFEEVYSLYFREVFLYVLAIAKDKEMAEEVTQQTFFKALKSINKFRGECDIKIWLFKIAKNTYYSYMKKKKRELGLRRQKRLH